MAEAGGFRARFPHAEGMAETVLINTGGGMTGGDSARFSITAETGAAALVTTQSAEKIYRSNGPDTQIDVDLDLHAASSLDWLPQETILFSGARLRRRLDVVMAGNARLLLAESTVFGRIASGETMGQGLFVDRWHVRRDGALIFAEALRFGEDIGRLLDRPALGGGARATATILYVAPDAESRLEEARQTLSDSACEAAATALNGMLLVRFLGPDATILRQAKIMFLRQFRGEEPPRLW